MNTATKPYRYEVTKKRTPSKTIHNTLDKTLVDYKSSKTNTQNNTNVTELTQTKTNRITVRAGNYIKTQNGTQKNGHPPVH